MQRLTITNKSLYLFLLNIYLVCLPLNAMNIGAFGSALKILAVLPILIALLSGDKTQLQKPLRWQFYFTIFAIMSIAWSTSYTLSISRCITYVLLFVLLLSASFFRFDEKELNKVKLALVWSSRITVVLMLLFADIIEGRLWLKGIITEDPNYICAYFAFGAVFALNKIMSDKRILFKLCGVLELCLYVYVVFLTGSRGGLISILSAIGIYIITFSKDKKKYIAAKIICFVFVFIAINVILDNLPKELRVRFSFDNVAASGGSGRTELWKNAIDMFKNANVFTKLFGFGTGTARYDMLHLGYSKVSVVHNIFLETLVELGIIGVIIYSVAIISFTKKAFQCKDKFALSVIACMIVLSLSTSIYAFKPYFNIMLFILMHKNETAEIEPVLFEEQNGNFLRKSRAENFRTD